MNYKNLIQIVSFQIQNFKHSIKSQNNLSYIIFLYKLSVDPLNSLSLLSNPQNAIPYASLDILRAYFSFQIKNHIHLKVKNILKI